MAKPSTIRTKTAARTTRKRTPSRLARPAAAHRKGLKFVYYFGKARAEGDGSMGELLGGKGANLAEMTAHIGVHSLAYVTIDGLYRAVGGADRDALAPQYCDACFSGDYPIPLIDHDGGDDNRQLSLLAEAE